MKREEFYPGQRVFVWFESGGSDNDRYNPYKLTIIRVNRKTVTVENSWKERSYVPFHVIDGIVDWEEEVVTK